MSDSLAATLARRRTLEDPLADTSRGASLVRVNDPIETPDDSRLLGLTVVPKRSRRRFGASGYRQGVSEARMSVCHSPTRRR